MNPNPIVRCVTSNFNNLFIVRKNFEILSSRIAICYFGTSEAIYAKKEKKWFWEKYKGKKKDGFEIIKPGNCADRPSSILNSLCKVAVVVGGSRGFGYAAADELLSRGARSVVIADEDEENGKKSAQKLCNAYGKDRALFLRCDIRDPVLFEGVFEDVLRRFRELHILFNDLDQNQTPLTSFFCGNPDDGLSNTRRASLTGLKYMRTDNGGSGGIIVNCASILGFMGWPENPTPVYCKKEPVIEVTRDVAGEQTFEKTGVRFVALCPSNKHFEKISLPDFPEIKDRRECVTECLPSKKITVGAALSHVMAWADSGSTWLLPPYPCSHELPRLIHFPKNSRELVDPKVYERKLCPVALEPHCAKILEDTKLRVPNGNCQVSCSKPKCKTLFSRKKG